jgi:outer membrane protein OmpA-like peptidoglycan-associated protein
MRCLAGRLAGIGALAVLVAAMTAPPSDAQETVCRIPLVPGLILLSTLQFPDGDRENVVELASVDSSGVRYSWRLLEIRKSGDTLAAAFVRHVRANDLAGAPRLDQIFKPSDPEQRPGYTAFSISSAVYQTLRDRGTAPYSVTDLESAGGVFDAVTNAVAGGVVQERVRYKGTLTRVSEQPAPFPLLVDGRRVMVPTLHLRGSFAKGPKRQEYEFWVLGDSAHPLLLKSVVDGHVFQVTRVNFPSDWAGGGVAMADAAGSEGNPTGTGTGAIPPADGAGSGGGTGGIGAGSGTAGAGMLERQLGTVCRIELPGVYFAFNSARIDPASDRSLGALARVLARHPDWRLTVEGHTDSIGTTNANQKLSQQRAEAVRARLKDHHGVDTRAWNAAGYGPSRPRESNATIEGRARNRRVELVRDC